MNTTSSREEPIAYPGVDVSTNSWYRQVGNRQRRCPFTALKCVGGSSGGKTMPCGPADPIQVYANRNNRRRRCRHAERASCCLPIHVGSKWTVQNFYDCHAVFAHIPKPVADGMEEIVIPGIDHSVLVVIEPVSKPAWLSRETLFTFKSGLSESNRSCPVACDDISIMASCTARTRTIYGFVNGIACASTAVKHLLKFACRFLH